MEYEAAYMAGRDFTTSFGTRQTKPFEGSGKRDAAARRLIVEHAKRLAPYGKQLVSIEAEGVMVWNQQDGWLPSQRSTR